MHTLHFRSSLSRFELAANSPSWKSNYDALGEAMFHAVTRYDLVRVRDLLERGANPNCNRQDNFLDQGTMKYLPTRLPDRHPAPEMDTEIMPQPTTPLKTLVFGIIFAYCIDNEFDVNVFQQMVQALLDTGADSEPAGRYVRRRYGRRGEPGRSGIDDPEFEQFVEDAVDS